jgi:mannose-6-phosphate isomerase-like protein (cupin superfamily)
MPVIRTSEQCLREGNRPEWCNVTSAGVFRVPAQGGRFDCHYHDFPEYWLIFKGRARIRSEGREYYVKPGDIVCTNTGDEHDVIEVYEDLEAFWFEEPCPPSGRVGHLHRDPEQARGHAVPAKPVPVDFPR